MSSLLLIFIPFVRLVGHSLASSFGFLGIAVTTVLPVHSVQMLSKYGALSHAHVQVLEILEIGLLALDVVLLVVVIALYSGLFVVEEWRTLRRMVTAGSK